MKGNDLDAPLLLGLTGYTESGVLNAGEYPSQYVLEAYAFIRTRTIYPLFLAEHKLMITPKSQRREALLSEMQKLWSVL